MYKKLLMPLLMTAATTQVCLADNKSSWPELEGEWESIACELRPQSDPKGVKPWYLKRRITFENGNIDAHFTNYADANCSMPLTEINFVGEVQIEGDSDVATGAKAVNLIINQKMAFAPQMPGFTDFLNSAEQGTCGKNSWQTGVQQDVFQTGCSVMGMEPGKPNQEFEVLYERAGMLYFGARPVDGNPLAKEDQRPTALQMPLQRVNGGPTQLVGAADKRSPTVVEVVNFKQLKDADPVQVEGMLHGYTKEMNKFDTLLYRTIAHDGEGNWTCLNYWTDLAAMEKLNADAQSWPSIKQFPELVDMSSFRIASYEVDYPEK